MEGGEVSYKQEVRPKAAAGEGREAKPLGVNVVSDQKAVGSDAEKQRVGGAM